MPKNPGFSEHFPVHQKPAKKCCIPYFSQSWDMRLESATADKVFTGFEPCQKPAEAECGGKITVRYGCLVRVHTPVEWRHRGHYR